MKDFKILRFKIVTMKVPFAKKKWPGPLKDEIPSL